MAVPSNQHRYQIELNVIPITSKRADIKSRFVWVRRTFSSEFKGGFIGNPSESKGGIFAMTRNGQDGTANEAIFENMLCCRDPGVS